MAIWGLLAILLCTLSARARMWLEQSVADVWLLRETSVAATSVFWTLVKNCRQTFKVKLIILQPSKAHLPNYVRRQDYLWSFELRLWVKHQKQHFSNTQSRIKDPLHFLLLYNQITVGHCAPLVRGLPGCLNLHVVEPHSQWQNVTPRRREAPLGVTVIHIHKGCAESQGRFWPNQSELRTGIPTVCWSTLGQPTVQILPSPVSGDSWPWSRPCWEYLHYGNWRMLQIKAFIS